MRGGSERELGWDGGGRWGAAFWPSFTLSVLLAGDSVQDLLITTQWSSNPTDLIDSDCCLGLTAQPNPPSLLSLSLYLSSQSPSPSPQSLIKHWYAWWPGGHKMEGCWEELELGLRYVQSSTENKKKTVTGDLPQDWTFRPPCPCPLFLLYGRTWWVNSKTLTP